jgi:hypothetical protein
MSVRAIFDERLATRVPTVDGGSMSVLVEFPTGKAALEAPERRG